MKQKIDELKDLLKSQGFKNTTKRDLIFETILGSKQHLSIDEIYQLIKKKDSNIGIATVFRTLKLLKKQDLVREIHMGDRKKRYEASLECPHHDHLICTDCGSVIEAVDPRIEKLQIELCKNNHFIPSSHRLEIFGICSECSRKGKS